MAKLGDSYKQYIGQKFNKLTVSHIAVFASEVWFSAQCDCGNTKLIRARNIVSGIAKSCGCLRAKKNYKRKSKTCRYEGDKYNA